MDKYLKNTSAPIEDKRKYFSGVVVNTILDTEVFYKNEDLKKYTNLYESFEDIDEYRPYLYKSRTLLVARLLKDIKFNLSDNQFMKVLDMHFDFIESKTQKLDKELESKKMNETSKSKQKSKTLLESYLEARRNNNDI